MKQFLFRLTLGLAAAAALGTSAHADGGANHQTKQSPPVKMGTSGGSVNDRSSAFCCGGTLGALVRRDGVVHILSNNHVVGRSGSAAAGEDTLQPGLIDTGCNGANSNIVGDYAGDIVPLGTANVDAAISVARSNVDGTGSILDIGVPCSGTQGATVGLPVMKSGRTTGFTTGTVQAVNVNVSIQYQRGCNQGRKFTVSYSNQISTSNMSAGGDSGSLLLSNDGTPHPVGLLFAGSSSVTIHNPIQHVVNAFSAGGHTFDFVGSSCASLTDGSEALSAGGRAPSAADVDYVREVKERHEADLFARRGVIGAGVGADEEDPEEAVIVLYVETDRAARPRGLPVELDGVKVRIVPTDPIVALNGCPE
ncbi:MAG TPA: hypothetical protein VJV23_13860 [Candidatus Polarisedimenticolia bacterium]|nr:hypothetical protein [Candidatus Polarisedimenticolia bacterium]